MKKEFTKKDYEDYMAVMDFVINVNNASSKAIESHKVISQLSFGDWVKFRNGELTLSETAVSKEFQWTDNSVIDFVNWFLKLHKLPFKYSLENMSILDSFKAGDDYKLWHKPKEKK